MPDMPLPSSPPETDAECKARHRAQLREMADLGMRAARSATARIEAQADAERADPVASLILARATNTVRLAIALEQRIILGAAPPPASSRAGRPSAAAPNPAAADPRRAQLRDVLRKAAARTEPDRAARTQLCRMVDEQLDAALLEDPDAEISIGQILLDVSGELGIPIDVSQLPDSLLGIPPRRLFPPSFDPENTG